MPTEPQTLGKFIVIIGLLIVAVGLLVHFSDRIPLIGRLPGDFSIRRENFSFYFPLGTSVLLSVLISLIIYLIRRFG